MQQSCGNPPLIFPQAEGELRRPEGFNSQLHGAGLQEAELALEPDRRAAAPRQGRLQQLQVLEGDTQPTAEAARAPAKGAHFGVEPQECPPVRHTPEPSMAHARVAVGGVQGAANQ